MVGTANERYVDQLFLTSLHRPAQPEGFTYWSGLLDQGCSRNVVVRGIAGSREARRVSARTYLGRDVSQGEVNRVL